MSVDVAANICTRSDQFEIQLSMCINKRKRLDGRVKRKQVEIALCTGVNGKGSILIRNGINGYFV